MASTNANAARNLNLDVWNLDTLIRAYEYRANPINFTDKEIESAISTGDLNVQSIFDEVTTSLEAGVTNTVINRTITTDPIINYQTVEVNIDYIVPVINEVSWDVNVSVDFITGETIHSCEGTLTLKKDGDIFYRDAIDSERCTTDGDNGNGGNGNNGHGNADGGFNPSNPGNSGGSNGNGKASKSLEPAPMSVMEAPAQVEVSMPEIAAMMTTTETLA